MLKWTFWDNHYFQHDRTGEVRSRLGIRREPLKNYRGCATATPVIGSPFIPHHIRHNHRIRQNNRIHL